MCPDRRRTGRGRGLGVEPSIRSAAGRNTTRKHPVERCLRFDALSRVMARPTEPPVEWVSGPRSWWLARFGVGIAASALLVIDLLLVLRGGFTSLSPYAWLAVWLVFLPVYLAQWILLSRIPSVRRIGISPRGLTVDYGLAVHPYAWPDLVSLTRVNETRYSWTGPTTVVRTRIRLGGIWGTKLTLTPEQGDRLARFLRVA
jgi:hypothetical protein